MVSTTSFGHIADRILPRVSSFRTWDRPIKTMCFTTQGPESRSLLSRRRNTTTPDTEISQESARAQSPAAHDGDTSEVIREEVQGLL
jgi:hypothetical protein